MWRGYPEAVARYGLEMCGEWCGRGHPDTCAEKIRFDLAQALGTGIPRSQQALREAGALPPWLGDPAVHRSHRSALLRKDPEHYRRLFPDTPEDLPYVWPEPPGTASAMRSGEPRNDR